MLFRTLLAAILSLTMPASAENAPDPMPVAIAGLTHAHVHWLLGREDRGDIEIVAIAEPDRALARRYTGRYGLSMDIVYDTLPELLEHHKPVAITAFGSIFDHLEVVEEAAPRGIHVMVEKPLAVNMAHARRMYALAEKHGIHLLTNYETTWYASHHKVMRLVESGTIAPVRKMVFHHGHNGPVKIGVNAEFLDWLADPVLNGGGALVDFGCYGANLATWLMRGQLPVSVLAVTQQLQPDLYPKVDDEATIIITYPGAQAIVQASWNWPYSRKDMEVYSVDGSVTADRDGVDIRLPDARGKRTGAPLEPPRDDPFALLHAVVAGEVELDPFDPSSLENNMLVVRILDAARTSAATGRAVHFNDDAGR